MKTKVLIRTAFILLALIFTVSGCGSGSGSGSSETLDNGSGGGDGSEEGAVQPPPDSACTYGVIIDYKNVCYDNEHFPTQAQIDKVTSQKNICPLSGSGETHIPPNDDKNYIHCIYHTDGYLWFEKEYRDGIQNGLALELRNDGSIRNYKQYSEGKLLGISVYLEKDLTITRVSNYYLYDRSLEIKYYDTHFTFEEEWRSSPSEKSMVGSRVEVVNSSVHSVSDYENDKRVKGMLFYVTGQLKQITPYKNSKVHGIQKSYYENGRTEALDPYNNGQRHGMQRTYYDSSQSQIRSEIVYKNGDIHGASKTYSSSGELTSCRNYVNGVDTSDCMPVTNNWMPI